MNIQRAFRLKLDGEWLEVADLRLVDLCAFEDAFGVSAQVLDDPGQVRLKWVAYLGWHALRRTNQLPNGTGEFEAFLAAIDDFAIGDGGGDEVGEAPGGEAQPTTSPPRSPASSASTQPASSTPARP